MISIESLEYAWPGGPQVLKIPQLQVNAGERVFIEGPSGSGKSTLLNLLAGLILPQQGRVQVLEQDLTRLSAAARDQFRVDHMGMIFQQFNLLPYLSVLENVTLPCRFSRVRRSNAKERFGSPEAGAQALLAHLELSGSDLLQRPVSELSIGQQQRVAAARALLGGPQLLIADEPTSALDYDSRDRFLDLLQQECDAQQATLLFVSHDRSLQQHFSRVIKLAELNKACHAHGEEQAC